MKLTRVIAATAAVMLLVAGCTSRNNNAGSSAPGVIPDVASSAQDEISKVESRIEDGLADTESRIEDALDMSGDEDGDKNESGMQNDEDNSGALTDTDPSTVNDESIAAAMSTDFSEIGALDGTKDTGFPGGPVDDQNRPSGPMGYQAKFGKYSAQFIVPDSKKIYLTFDEGYENGYTSKILDVLKEKGVKAVFFITYPYAESEPELVKRMVDEGHALGNHSTAHKIFPEMPLTEAANDLMKLHGFVKSNYGYEMTLFRPPEGAFSEQTLALAQSLGYSTVLWSFAYKDYDVNNQPLTIEALDKIVNKAHPGEICLLHAVSKTNAEVLGEAIDQLRDKGYAFSDYFIFN